MHSLALLALGIRNIRLGPTLPPFLSPVVVAALQQKYDLKAVTTPENDLQATSGETFMPLHCSHYSYN